MHLSIAYKGSNFTFTVDGVKDFGTGTAGERHFKCSAGL